MEVINVLVIYVLCSGTLLTKKHSCIDNHNGFNFDNGTVKLVVAVFFSSTIYLISYDGVTICFTN